MGFLSKLLGTDREGTYKTCTKIYNKTKKKNPGRPENDYLLFVLLTKPPFDYQFDSIVDSIIKENQTIEELSRYISQTLNPKSTLSYKDDLWKSRERNLSLFPEIKQRNEAFFKYFWG